MLMDWYQHLAIPICVKRHFKDEICKISIQIDQVSHSVAHKTESLSAFSSSLRSSSLYPYGLQDISVFKLQSQHFCKELFILWCLNMLIFQCQKPSDTSRSDARHQVWGRVYGISLFHCIYKSYLQAFRKHLFSPSFLSAIEKTIK